METFSFWTLAKEASLRQCVYGFGSSYKPPEAENVKRMGYVNHGTPMSPAKVKTVLCVGMYVCNVCMYVCMCVCMHVCVYVYM